MKTLANRRPGPQFERVSPEEVAAIRPRVEAALREGATWAEFRRLLSADRSDRPSRGRSSKRGGGPGC
jgi:hypothetical protein